MATSTADALAERPATGTFALLADTWIYVFMAALFLATTLAAFVPESIGIVRDVTAGRRPSPLPVLHAHAVTMGSWLLLLLTQTLLVARGRRTLHRKLGMASLVLAPLMVAIMIAQVRSNWLQTASIPAGVMPPDMLSAYKIFKTNILPDQARSAVLFAVFVGWAFLARRGNPETHKRLMILATLMPLQAGIDRIVVNYGFPSSLPVSYVSEYAYAFLWLAPALLYDVIRRGRPHQTYVIGLLCNVPFAVVTVFLWGSPWWLATAPRLMGVQGW